MSEDSAITTPCADQVHRRYPSGLRRRQPERADRDRTGRYARIARLCWLRRRSTSHRGVHPMWTAWRRPHRRPPAACRPSSAV